MERSRGRTEASFPVRSGTVKKGLSLAAWAPAAIQSITDDLWLQREERLRSQQLDHQPLLFEPLLFEPLRKRAREAKAKRRGWGGGVTGGQGSDGMRRGCRGCPCWKMLCPLSRIPFMLRAWGGRSFPSRVLRLGANDPATPLRLLAHGGCSLCLPPPSRATEKVSLFSLWGNTARRPQGPRGGV